MSEQILLLNPRRKHKKRRSNRRRRSRGRMPAGLARYWASRRGTNPRRRRRSNRRRHARRANPSHVLRTGRHYRARSRRRSNRRHHARRRRSNPRFHLPSGRGILGKYVVPMAVGGVGGLVLDIAWGFLSPKLPPSIQTGYVGLAAKLGVVLGIAFGLNRFMPGLRVQTERGMIGAGSVLFYGAVKGIAQSVLPATTPGLSGYIDYQSYALPGAGGRLSGYMTQVPRTLGSLEDLYSPAAVIQPPGTAVPRQFGHLRGYIAAQPHMSSGGGLMGYDWQNDGM